VRCGGVPSDSRHHCELGVPKRHTVRSYCSSLRISIHYGQGFGWSAQAPRRPEWEPIRIAVGTTELPARSVGLRNPRRDCPFEFTNEPLETGAKKRTRIRRSPIRHRKMKEPFRREIVRAGLQASLTRLDASTKDDNSQSRCPYQPFTLLCELSWASLLQWKQAEFAPGRPRNCKTPSHNSLFQARTHY